MKEFDYEKAKAGAPVCTREGRPARIICWDYKEYGRLEADEKFPIMALVKFDKGERPYLYRENGTTADNRRDLMMAPVKHEGWVNIYRTGDASVTPHVYGPVWPDEASAKENAKESTTFIDTHIANHVTTVKIEWEE